MKVVNPIIFYFVFIISIFFVLTSCNNSKYKDESRLFSEYLKNAFDKTIQTDSAVFIVIPEYTCNSCVKTYISKNDNFTQDAYEPDKFIIISSNNAQLSNVDTTNKNVLVDRENEIDYITFLSGGITVLYTKQGKIINIKRY